ncbi:conserved hypothetical protein [Ktedonobacter racemifer DSM 44963]|uniref:Uncharacterized protein n=1 Tax=Ktedonobacter racemifer DSM 44963 TaxID=485913 RepID=D6U2J7_KTERA|nr:conserved hypothetical protein [Ktedonobacter racemifer DSM 44963]
MYQYRHIARVPRKIDGGLPGGVCSTNNVIHLYLGYTPQELDWKQSNPNKNRSNIYIGIDFVYHGHTRHALSLVKGHVIFYC